MTPRWHLLLMTVSIVLGALGGAIGGMVLVGFVLHGQEISPQWFLTVCVGFVAGAFLVPLTARAVFTHVILAKCPHCGCGAKFRGGKHVQYICQTCGHVHDTGFTQDHKPQS